jgi:hypothetical protein
MPSRQRAKLRSGSWLYGGVGVRSGGRNEGAGKPTGFNEAMYVYIAARSSSDVSRKLHHGMGARGREFLAATSHASTGMD